MTDTDDRVDMTPEKPTDEPTDGERDDRTATDGERATPDRNGAEDGDSPSECSTDQGDDGGMSRRSLLQAGTLLGILGFGSGYATGRTSGGGAQVTARGQVGTSQQPLQALYTTAVNGPLTGGAELTDLAGAGLAINAGTLEATATGAWADDDGDGLLEPAASKTGVDVGDVQTDSLNGGVTGNVEIDSLLGTNLTTETDNGVTSLTADGVDVNDGATIVSTNVDTLSFGTDLDVTTDSEGSVIVDATASGNTQVDVSNDGSTVVESAGDIDFGSNLTASDDGDGTASVGVTGSPTWTGTHTWDTAAGANLHVDETGVYYDTSNSETLDVRNAGAGSLTLQEDGTSVVTETRWLTAGHAVQSLGLGDLSADRTVAVDATGLAGSFLSAAGPSSALDVNLGNGLEGGGSDIRVDVSAIAGDNLTADTTNNELDAASAAFSEQDSDGLLEIDGPETGIDVPTVRVANIRDANNNNHLALTNGGPLYINQALDTNGNGIQSGRSVSVDIDANGDGTSETFTVTKNGESTTLLTVNEGGRVDINSGDLDVSGAVTVGNIPSDSGGTDLGFDSNGQLVDISSSSARYKTDIRPLDVDTGPVLDLEPKAFEYERDGSRGVGFVAEDADETFPEIVHYDDQGRPDGIDYKRLAVYLLPEIRANRARLDDLEAENERLREETDDLRSENEQLRERLAAVEAELGLDDTMTVDTGVADD
jgi:hypothetical protein